MGRSCGSTRVGDVGFVCHDLFIRKKREGGKKAMSEREKRTRTLKQMDITSSVKYEEYKVGQIVECKFEPTLFKFDILRYLHDHSPNSDPV